MRVNMENTEKCSTKITIFIANTFYRLGFTIASNPFKTILIVILISIICCLGFLKFEVQKDPVELWVPRDSDFKKTTQWILNTLNTASRLQTVLITAPNVLEPLVLNKLLTIHHEIKQVTGDLKDGRTIEWSDVCLKIPFISQISSHISKPEITSENATNENSILDIFGINTFIKKIKKEFEPSVDLPSIFYCSLLNNLPKGCYERNFLEIFNYTQSLERNLTLNDVINLLKHNETVSPVTGHNTDFSELLGGIETNEKREIIKAKAIIIQWFVNLNLSDVTKQNMGNLAGTESWITEEAAVWEDSFLKNMKKLKLQLDTNETKIYYSAEKSFGDISHDALFQESNNIGIGIVLMIIYIQIVLSKFSWIEFRFGLSGMGLLSVGLAFLSACGICSILNINYGPVHTSLPFLLMGLGVDDMFVLMACWRNIEDEDKTIEEKVGLMLKSAGSSITITSLTDVIAFLVGSTTVIPSLQSFCLYAAVGIFMTYLYAITFFIAIFTLDEYRIKANRNAFIPFIVHKKKNPKFCCDYSLMNKSFDIIYGKFILTKYGKIIILMTVVTLTAISGQNLLKIEQKFDPSWFIPESTYLHDYLQQSDYYFPEFGYKGSVFMGKLNYSQNLQNILKLTYEIENSDMFYKTNSWIQPFEKFLKRNYDFNINTDNLSDLDFKFYLSKFLFSTKGGKYQSNFNFEQKLECGQPTPNITLSWIDFRFKKFLKKDEYLPAMRLINTIINTHFNETSNEFVKSWSKAYGNWITDEIIDRELYRNIILVLICVMFCTFVIIVDIQVCIWICICVLLTVVNVGGFMHLWGLTIDLVSCIGLQLAVGLCVDYSAHIGHTFLATSDGDRNKRVLTTILHIGAAVFYGGVSTLLSVLILSKSQAYTFQSFFKIFFLVVVFGLFHGLVLLPVILSLIGSKPYLSKKGRKEKNITFDKIEMVPINSNDIN